LAILLFVAVGSFISMLLIAREQGKTKIAYQGEQKKATEAEEQRIRAEKSFREARDAVGFFTRIAADEMDKPELMNAVRKTMLEASLAYYQSFLEQRKDDPTVGPELAAARSRVSTILAELSAVDAYFRLQSQLRLLSEESAQTDLKLSTEQAGKVRVLIDTYGIRGGPGGPRGPGAAFQELRQMTAEQKQEHFSKLAGEIQQGLAAALTSVQLTRLQQIHRQKGGPFAFSDADVAEPLALSADQKNRIRAVQAEYRDSHFRRPPFADRSQEKMQKDWVAMILEQLTPEQIAVWKTLTGEPFSGPMEDQHFGPPRRGPEPGRDEAGFRGNKNQ
jgi:hypothetical protein